MTYNPIIAAACVVVAYTRIIICYTRCATKVVVPKKPKGNYTAGPHKRKTSQRTAKIIYCLNKNKVVLFMTL